MKRDILKETDALLAGIDGDLRSAQDIRTRAAVDRLIESAAQGCNGVTTELMDEVDMDGISWLKWRDSLHMSATGISRMCQNGCCMDVHPDDGPDLLDCRENEPETDSMGLQSFFFEKRVPRTNLNMSVLDFPPDGVEVGYRL